MAEVAVTPAAPEKGTTKARTCCEVIERSCCCWAVAWVGLPCLERRRYRVLPVCVVLTCIGLALNVVGFYGGYSKYRGDGHLAWVVFRSPDWTAYGGVHWICQNPGEDGKVGWPDGNEEVCRLIKRVSCSGDESQSRSCNLCKKQAVGMATSVIIGLIAYALFLLNTYKRYSGWDRPVIKFMSCFASLVGGTNFLVAILAYRSSCVHAVKHEYDGVDSEPGAGLILVFLSVVLQIVAGTLHLGLPVTSSKEGSQPEETEGDETAEAGEVEEEEGGRRG